MPREKVYVVDENDNVIAEKWRDELTEADHWRIIAVWIENSNGDILIQQRSLDKDLNPGLWTAGVVGTVVVGESYEEAAKKELEEEVGVQDTEIELIKSAHYKASTGWRNIHTFKCIVDKKEEDFVIQEEEVKQVKWVTPKELRSRLASKPREFAVPNQWQEIYNFS